MTAKEWLDVMKQAADYNPAMTNLIEKYGEMLLEERKVANKNFVLADVIGSLPAEIYVTYDTHDGEVLCAFVDKEQCKREAEECGCGMQTVRLVSNDR